jgi:hypothetical protein
MLVPPLGSVAPGKPAPVYFVASLPRRLTRRRPRRLTGCVTPPYSRFELWQVGLQGVLHFERSQPPKFGQVLGSVAVAAQLVRQER